MAEHPAVTLQILPFTAGPHSAMGGPFTILRFAEPDLHDVVYIEQLTSALYLDKPSEVDSYLEVMEQLCLQAEPAGNTVKMLNQILGSTRSKSPDASRPVPARRCIGARSRALGRGSCPGLVRGPGRPRPGGPPAGRPGPPTG